MEGDDVDKVDDDEKESKNSAVAVEKDNNEAEETAPSPIKSRARPGRLAGRLSAVAARAKEAKEAEEKKLLEAKNLKEQISQRMGT